MHFKGDPIPSVDCPRGRGQRQLLFEWVGSCGVTTLSTQNCSLAVIEGILRAI
jgi:hypothetical protein